MKQPSQALVESQFITTRTFQKGCGLSNICADNFQISKLIKRNFTRNLEWHCTAFAQNSCIIIIQLLQKNEKSDTSTFFENNGAEITTHYTIQIRKKSCLTS
jgi:hypothetical protein